MKRIMCLFNLPLCSLVVYGNEAASTYMEVNSTLLTSILTY